MEFRILGPLEVVENGQALDLGAQKQRAMFAMLLLNANEVVSADLLTEALWEGDPPATAAKVLQVYVSRLRKTLGHERLETRAPGYLLRVHDGELDLARFHALRAEARPHEALSLWRGPPLSEFAYHRFAQTEIAQLEELRLSCREERIDADLASGRHADVVAELEALVVESPLREGLRARLMLALYRSGRQAEALAVYDSTRRALVDDLGIEPSRELRELHQAILNQDPALDLLVADVDSTGRGTFVGREVELQALTAALDDAFAGRGRLLLLAGEPGIGKSRLAEEVSGAARRRGAHVLVGRCWEAGGAPAYWPWVQSLRAYARQTDSDTLRRELGTGAADLAQLLPELHELLPGLADLPDIDPESARFRLFEAVTAFLTAPRHQPLVLVLDDLHAADEPSLLLLRFVAREVSGRGVLVIGAYRDVDPTLKDPLASTVAELSREPSTTTLSLSGLDAADVRRFVEVVAGGSPADELVTAIHDDTSGNPLFVGEIVRLLATEGHLDDAAARRPPIPQSVRDVIARRLEHLQVECRQLLVLASILGREFDPAVLALVAELEENEVLDALDEAMTARVVSDVPGTRARLRFSHVLIRDTLYEGLTTARRVRLHRQVVAVLEAARRSSEAELAYHSIAGSDFAKGLLYARRAGDRALSQLAYEEAARLYALALEALELVDPDDAATRCELLLDLGEAEVRAGHSADAKRTFLAAADLARELGHGPELARAAAGYAGRIVWARAGTDECLVPLLEEGLEAVPAESVELRARLLARLAGALRDEHSRERRAALSAEAVELARRTGNPAALAYALDGRGYAILAADTTEEVLGVGRELGEVAGLVGDRERILASHMLRTICFLFVGEAAAATRHHREALRMAQELRQPAQLWQAYGDETMLALAQGKLRDAERLMAESLAYGERALPEAAVPIHCLQSASLARLRGDDLAGFEPKLQAIAAAHPKRPVFRCAVANLQAHLGRSAEAARQLSALAADPQAEIPFDQEWLLAVALLAETASILRDEASAEKLYPLLLPWSALNAVDVAEGYMGSVSRYLGLLAGLLGRTDDAARHFEEAVAMNERMGARPWLAYAKQDYARLLARSDPPRAAELLAEARMTYRELGMREPV